METPKNAKPFGRLDTALVGKLQGDALAMFQNTGTKYLKCGFTKLAALKDNFAAESDLALAREMFAFFKGLEQGDTSLLVYKRKLRYGFECFNLAKCPLSLLLQVMFQVRGLNKKYSKLEVSLRDQTRAWQD